MNARWRLLVTEPADGATNMAVDEVLWRGRRAGTAPPTLRFFSWAPPTVSLGYGQSLAERPGLAGPRSAGGYGQPLAERPGLAGPRSAGGLGGPSRAPHPDVAHDVCRALGVGLVRRPTGGSAIYHDGPERELTYSVAATNDDLGVGVDLLASYRWIARALARGLRDLGVPVEIVERRREYGPVPAFCFARTGTYELELDGRKIVGSAQRRHGKSFLQHGSIVLGLDVARVTAIFPATSDPAASVATLEQALGRRPDWDACVTALAAAFEAEHGLDLRPGGLTAEEADQIDTLAREKYATDAWLAGHV